ncbi:hypothetical protein K504DRAFT_111153 [Pleomassaria siparia CBS 279.74]|uniref:Uncharacterized protein n=1 Tax=Pleomassaria siparia CBS 279.74 TaxID=1314801 RepID=A0A6G1JX17_9PLEO|nr:hypothetical protein K504DRAFT_111153 [Pleomassaria siparia CBS 279.74]
MAYTCPGYIGSLLEYQSLFSASMALLLRYHCFFFFRDQYWKQQTPERREGIGMR